MAGPAGNPLTAIPDFDQRVLVTSVSNEGTFVTQWKQFFISLKRVLSPGINASVTLAKLTTGGTNGSLTFVNGILTAYTAPT